MNSIELVPPRFLKLGLVSLATVLIFLPSLITVLFTKTLAAPGNPPTHLYVMFAIWCGVVGWAFWALFRQMFSSLRAATRLEIDFPNEVLRAHGKTLKVESFQLNSSTSPPRLRIVAGGQIFLVTGKWSGFYRAVNHLRPDLTLDIHE